jgi:hypothetical protein
MSLDRRSRDKALVQPASRDRHWAVDGYVCMLLAREADEHASEYDRETHPVPDYISECDTVLGIRILGFEWFNGARAKVN